MNKEQIITFCEEMIDTLTFRRVALLSLLAVIMISLLMVFENRSVLFTTIFKRAANPSTAIAWELSDESKVQLKGTTNNLVAGLILNDVDLRKNRRTVKYFTFKNPQLQEQVRAHLDGMLPQPLFDYDAKNTTNMVAMLNNEFRCTPARENSPYRVGTTIFKPFTHTCRIAVPPFFGEFAGFITIVLTRAPSTSEFEALKIEMSRIAVELYFRDVAKKSIP